MELEVQGLPRALVLPVKRIKEKDCILRMALRGLCKSAAAAESEIKSSLLSKLASHFS